MTRLNTALIVLVFSGIPTVAEAQRAPTVNAVLALQRQPGAETDRVEIDRGRRVRHRRL